ncbi:MAG: HNH endonuclease [Geminicoccaceae bacterium]
MSAYGWAGGSTRRWRTLRTAHLRREPWCRLCAIRGQQTRATEVDHVIPLARGGALYDPANLRSLCQGCHVERHGGRRRVRIDPRSGLPLPGEDHPWAHAHEKKISQS